MCSGLVSRSIVGVCFPVNYRGHETCNLGDGSDVILGEVRLERVQARLVVVIHVYVRREVRRLLKVPELGARLPDPRPVRAHDLFYILPV